jgi:hypothetical protein
MTDEAVDEIRLGDIFVEFYTNPERAYYLIVTNVNQKRYLYGASTGSLVSTYCDDLEERVQGLKKVDNVAWLMIEGLTGKRVERRHSL